MRRNGLWLMALAVWCQILMSGLMPVMALAMSLDPTVNFAICRSGGATAEPGQSTPANMPDDCTHCPLCHAFGHAGDLSPPQMVAIIEPYSVPAPRPIIALVVARQSVAVTFAQPRAPPTV
jgi:hypothetical protein